MTSRAAQTALMLLALPLMWAGTVIAMTIVLLFNTVGGIGRIWRR
jgi:hypothetical protein